MVRVNRYPVENNLLLFIRLLSRKLNYGTPS